MAAQETAIHNKAFRLKKFIRETRTELKKVAWPDKKALIGYTGIVGVSVVFTAIIIWLIDTVFTELLKVLMK